jgi:hypothetical protein
VLGAWNERGELVLSGGVRPVDDRPEVPRDRGRYHTVVDVLRDELGELLARREHDERHWLERRRRHATELFGGGVLYGRGGVALSVGQVGGCRM